MAENPNSTGRSDLVSSTPELTLADFCIACDLTVGHITAYVEEGIIKPHGSEQVEWRFSRISLIEVRRAFRLERNLGLNAAGVALALELMEKIELLNNRLARLEERRPENVDL